MTPETQQSESPYAVKIETAAGKSTTVPIAVLTAKELEVFLQVDFKKLAQEAGVKGARVHEQSLYSDNVGVLSLLVSFVGCSSTNSDQYAGGSCHHGD